MRALRKGLQVVALVGTLMVGIVAVALIVSQTPWFRDWVRRYIVRESKQYLNGELSIGRIGGNLLFGVEVSDIAVDVSGERIVAAKTVEVDYSIFQLLSKSVVLNEIKLVEPALKLERDGQGWNIAHLVKRQQKEADREGPRKPITLESIEIADGRLTIADHVGADGYRLPQQIDDLDLKASYSYAPVHYSVVIDRVSLRSSAPQLALTELAGKLAVREDALYVEKMSIRTAESRLTIDGVVEQYLKTPVVKVTTTGSVSLPEIARVLPAAAGYGLHPQFDVKASGPADNLALDLAVQSEAGDVRGQVTADVQAPDFAARGSVQLERVDLAPIIKKPSQRSDITGTSDIDLRLASGPASRPLVDRVAAVPSSSEARRSQAPGYDARNVRATGSFAAGRSTLDAGAAAYGGTGTAKGFIALPAPGRALAFELRGTRRRRRPAESAGAAQRAEARDRSLVARSTRGGTGPNVSGSALLKQSTVEGANLNAGTTGEFGTGRDGVSYGGRGRLTGLNVRRVGKALRIAALDKPAYDGTLNGGFDVAGSVPPQRRRAAGESRVAELTLDAKGTLTDSTIMGGRLPTLAYETHLAGGALNILADGRFEGFDPATLVNRKEIAGNVSGTLNVNVQLADITAPVTPESVAADGRVALEKSTVGGLAIDDAGVEGKYAAQVADVKRLQVNGPDVKVEASGRVALNRTSDSNLKYHVEAIDLTELGRLAGQTGVDGSAVLDGTVTGNAASLQTAGTLDGSNVGYRENKSLDLDSKYTVTLPDLNMKQIRVEADTNASFIKAGALQLNAVTAKTTYSGDRLQFTTNVKEEKRELDAAGEVILHTDHQEIHLPQLAVRTQGIQWRSAPGSEATVQYGQGRVQVDNLRLSSGDQALVVNGAFAVQGESPAGAVKVQAANVDLQQLQTLLLTDRGLSGKLSAAATISGTAKSPVVDGQVEVANGAFQGYRYQSLTADLDYTGDRLGVDAVLQQSPTEAITAKGSVPMTLFKPGTGEHVDESAKDTVDLRVKSTAMNLGIVQGFMTQVTGVSGTLEADVHITGSGADPHLQGFVDIKNGAFGVPAGGVFVQRSQHPDRSRARQGTVAEVRDSRRARRAAERLRRARRARAPGRCRQHRDRLRQFRVIDNELGDVGIDSTLTITGELRRPQIRGIIRFEAARLEVDRILQLFYDPYSVEGLPPVVSAERTAEASGSAQEATAAALKRAETTAAVPGTRRRPKRGALRRRAAGSRRSNWICGCRCRTTSCCAAGSCGRGPDRRLAWRYEHHRRRRSAGRQAGQRPGTAARHDRDGARHL